ncbi:MAG TPA: tetratricopeptide repeat protein, partial [Pirellulales bacterium]|nr:tetratricopeptide repeat protein [Pirellulales bacterium]
ERDELVNLASEMIDQRPNLPAAWREYLLAKVALFRGSPNNAIEHFKGALVIDPRNAAWRFELVRLLEQLNRRDEALAEATVCWQLEPGSKQYEEAVLRLEWLNSSAHHQLPSTE